MNNELQISSIILAFIVAFIATTISTPVALYFIKKFHIYDDPKSHKHPAILHKTPIPRGGGIPLYIGVLVAGLIFLPINHTTLVLYFASFLALAIGVLDDKLDVSPYLRFLANLVTAGLIIASGITIPYITNPLGGILYLNSFTIPFTIFGLSFVLALSDFIALVWIVWVMNMLNWSKGVDGQMPGIVAISAIAIGLLSLRFPYTDSNTYIAANLSFILAGSAVGFLLFNFHPAKIFPGYGATAIYLLLSVVSFLSGAKLATAILVMGVPMIDGAFTVMRRILRGRSPFWHDNKHLHHILLRLGMGQNHIALFYWTISAILGLLSLTLTSHSKFFAIIMLVVIVGGGLLFLHYIVRNNEKNSI